MARISKEILEKIERESIKPIGRWSFVIRDSFVWFLFVLNILFGSIGFAISMYLFELSDVLNLILSVNDLIQIFILAIPVIWILLTLIFIFVGYINLKYTKDGYRYSIFKIFLINILLIIILGTLLSKIGVSERLNTFFAESIPSYEESTDPRYTVWSRPVEGYLAGEILSIESNMLTLEDLEGKKWSIDYSNAYIRGLVSLDIGERVKVRGSIEDESVFNATDILPWEGKGRHMQQRYH
ncbi:MAG TPA: hypothetical protein PKH06_02065 [Candidatus Dojkabacteria bacterium]|nr:hypothetical protein [Candidatus Dojkabacteria bacterium]